MPRTSLLQFAEHCRFSQLRLFAGEVLYAEGMPASSLYVVKDGEIDLFLVRDEKRTVVETLGKGQCFGVEPHLGKPTRLQGAVARRYCELYVIDLGVMGQAVGMSPDLVQGLLHTMSERLTVAHGLIASRVNHQPDLQLYAQLLYLMGAAEVGKSAVHGRSASAGGTVVLARPLLQDVMAQARVMFGHADRHIRACLEKLVNLHLVRIDDERGTGKQVIFAPRDIVAQVRKCLAQAEGAGEKQTHEYIGVGEFAQMVDVDRSTLLRKLASGEFAEDVFTFRRSEIVRLLDEKGRRYFVERRMKSPAEFTDVTDIEFADAKAVHAVVAKMDTYDLAKVLSTLDEGPVRNKVLGALSRRRRDDVESDLRDLGPVDPVEAQLLGQALVKELKSAMLEAA
jgi:CRP-like cAMP-binding protein